jgi:hypothetical protein
MAEQSEKVIVTADEFVKTIVAKVGEFDTELKAIVMDIGKAFEKTAQEITTDREHIAADRAELHRLKARVEALERQSFGLPPKLDA